MSERLNLDYLTRIQFVSEPQLRPLEMAGRMILAAAAIEDAHYGHRKDGLLQLYQHDEETIHAEYKKLLGAANDRFERIVVNLGKTMMNIAIEHGFTDWSGQINHFVDRAVIAPKGSSHTASSGGLIFSEGRLEGTALAQYSFDLQCQIDDFEILLPERSFFAEQ